MVVEIYIHLSKAPDFREKVLLGRAKNVVEGAKLPFRTGMNP